MKKRLLKALLFFPKLLVALLVGAWFILAACIAVIGVFYAALFFIPFRFGTQTGADLLVRAQRIAKELERKAG